MVLAGPFHGNPIIGSEHNKLTYRKFRRNATLQQVNLAGQRLAW